MANNARMIDPTTYIAAGLNPEVYHRPSCSGMTTGITTPLKDNLKAQYQLMDRETACNRYEWTNLPVGMSSQDLERMLYYKGQLAFFYVEDLNQFFILPYAGHGIDVYGRFQSVHPVPVATTTESDTKETKAQIKALTDYFADLKLEVQYDVILPEELIEDPDRYINKSCVLIKDYTNGISSTNTPRSQLQQPLLDIMSNCIPYLNTALMNSVGVSGVKVNSGDEQAQVSLAASLVQGAALNGEKWVPMKGNLDFQDLSGSNVAQAADFLLALQSLDNIRLSFYGLDNGGIYQKKAHMLESEAEMNMSSSQLVFQDGLDIRQRFCNIINSIWGIGIWCEPKQVVPTMIDMDQDGTPDTESAPTNENEGGTADVSTDNN